MKSFYCAFPMVVVLAFNAFGQTAAAFPGVTARQLTQLRTIKQTIPVPLPTWLPPGFKLEKIRSKLGRSVKIYEREMVLIYSRTLPNGKMQRFALEAGFDGLGDLMYDETKIISSSLGRIYLIYEPFDPEENKKLENYAMTQWFRVGTLDYHYVGMYGFDEGDNDMEMISLAETERILKSLRRL
ncbi:MAG TPA: hypothetical protein PKD26_03545 [Pyrinomonadaceae bacterium]|nr:hypothetical protein [Pyrinomonadaceae bacterium]